jgi:hypothetical protein
MASYASLDKFDRQRSGHFALPTRHILGIGLFSILLEFEQAENQIAQRGHGLGSFADTGGVFPVGSKGTSGDGSPGREPSFANSTKIDARHSTHCAAAA